MNIYLTSLLYKPNVGGVETSISNLAREYQMMGHKVTILTTTLPVNLNLLSSEIEDGIQIIRYRWRSNSFLIFPLSFIWNMIFLRKWFRDNVSNDNYLIISRHHIMSLAAIFARRRNVKYLVPEVVLKKGSKFNRFSKRNIEMVINSKFQIAALRLVPEIFVFSENIKKQLGVIGINKKIDIVKPGIDIEKFTSISKKEARKALRINENAKVFLGLGRFIEAKGFKIAIESFELLNDPNALLLLVGEGPLKSSYENLIEERKLKDCVLIFDKTSNPEVFYAASDVFLMTSYNEAFGQTILEAMCASLGIIAFKNGKFDNVDVQTASCEILEEFGALFCMPSKEELCIAMKKIVNNHLFSVLGHYNFAQTDGYKWRNLAEKLIHEN